MLTEKQFLELPMDERRRLLWESAARAAICEACEHDLCVNDPQKAGCCPLEKLPKEVK